MKIQRRQHGNRIIPTSVFLYSILMCGPSQFANADTNAGGIAIQQGSNCLNRIRGTSALSSNGKIRFTLHDPRVGYKKTDAPDTIVDVETELVQPNILCEMRMAPNGGIMVGGITIVLNGGPKYSGAHRELGAAGTKFGVGIVNTSPNVLTWERNLALKQGSWVPRGVAFGLQRYQQVVGIENGKVTPKSIYLGARYVGKTAAGHFLTINCVDFDYRRDIACHLQIEVRRTILLSVLLPTENIARWAEYSSVAEEYFSTHVES